MRAASSLSTASGRRNRHRPLRVALVAPLLILFLAGCDRTAPGGTVDQGPLLIVPSRISPDEQLGSFRVGEMDVRPEAADSTSWTGRVSFLGTVTLSGAYRPHPEYPDAEALCFYPDSASAAQLPRFPNDERISWFCFANHEDAVRDLGGPQARGEATIVINQYDYLYEHTDIYNTAILRQVLRRKIGEAGG